MKIRQPRDKFSERVLWLIKLRWLAVLGVFFTVPFATLFLKLPIKTPPILIIAVLLFLSNLAYLFLVSRAQKKEGADLSKANSKIANLQIFLDLTFLATLIHFSGGIENPFIFYFIFHMIIASILLSRKASFLQATYSVVLFSLIVFAEYLEVLPHYCLRGFVPATLHSNILHIFGVSFVFISTIYIAVYMASSITKILRKREKDLEKANLMLNEKDRIKSEYVLRVTHDIKEHLAAIQSCIEPVTEGITGSLNEKQKDLLFRAEKRAGKLLFFVRALLEITKIKLTRELKLAEFSFRESMKGILEDINLRAKNKNLNFNFELDPAIDKVRGVRLYIEEAILNLLANSIKYTPEGGEIYFEAKGSKDIILIKIKDTGIGIPEEDLPHIFDEFYRASNAKEKEKMGTGLGISIAKKIIEMHKGRIWVESEKNKRTVFFIELPICL